MSNRKVGGGRSATEYRHPLLARINPFLECLRGLPDPGAGRGVRWTPVAAATAAVLMALNAGCSLGDRCADAVACMDKGLVRRRRVGRTYNGLLKALERQEALLVRLKQDLRCRTRALVRHVPRAAGWVLLAADGSKEDLPRTSDNEEVFGLADNGQVPQAFTTVIVEVSTGLVWDWRVDRGSASEKGHLVAMTAELPDDAPLLADGNFVGHPIWSGLDRAGKHFLIRVGGNVGLLKDLWPGTVTERQGDLVYAWPKPHRHRVAPLRLRLIRVGSRTSPVYLLTNVLDQARLPRRAAGMIYRKRWGVELFYRMLKRTLGYAKLRSKAGRRARLELEWGLIAASIMTMLGVRALRQAGRDCALLSPASLVRVLRGALRTGQTGHGLDRALAACVRDTYTRRRPKRSRHRPITKNTPRPLRLKPPRVRRATPAERLYARRYLPQLAA